jgi:xanthine dehydrogenase YagR molybdenum-binding subunit
METHGNTVSWTDDGVMAWASTQGITSVHDGLASALKVDQSKVRVITDYMGGGFGAKFGPGPHGIIAAKLSREAKAPVRLMLTRFDQALAVGNRPSTFQKIKLGALADGTLHAFQLDNYGTSGIGAGAATGGGGAGSDVPAPYIYKVPNTRVNHTAVATNAGPASAFRAPRNPPASFGMESAMDDLAVKMNIDPVELRLKNDPSEIRQRELKLGAERIGWKDKYKKPGSSPGVVKTGLGCAGSTWGGGGNRRTKGEAQINPDGTVEVRMGVQDLGTCASISPTVLDTCTNALDQLQKTSGIADARGDNWFKACKKLGVSPLIVQGQWQEGLSSSGAGGVQFAEVDVDTETGLVTVKKIVAVHDCGLMIDTLTLESQINGGIIMGMGYALYEERVMDDLSGVMLNPNFETYKLATISDIPEIEVTLVNMPERGVIGIGEPATIPTAAAIANAVANAIGVRVTSLPITPAKVLAALGKVNNVKTNTAGAVLSFNASTTV